MPRIGPVSITNVALQPRSASGTFGATATVTLPSLPTGPWTAKAVTSTPGIELPVTRATLNTGTRALAVTVDNIGVLTPFTVTGIVVDY